MARAAPIYGSIANQPQGIADVTITAVVFVVNSIDLNSSENRIVSRTTGDGDRADFMIRKGGDQIEGTMELQRSLTTTVLPSEGDTFTYDFDASGTPSTIVIKDAGTGITQSDMDVFTVAIVLVTYQA
jgi:hypothetical protein